MANLPLSSPIRRRKLPRKRLLLALPPVRKFARELGVPLEKIAGSGEKGRITQSDVQAYTRGARAAAGRYFCV